MKSPATASVSPGWGAPKNNSDVQPSLTRVTQCVFKRDISPDGRPLRLRQHGTFFSCSHKNSRCEFLCEQDRVSATLPEALSSATWGIT